MPRVDSVPPVSRAEVAQRQRVLDPELWLTAAAWTVIALSALQILLFSFGRDQGIFAVIGDGILRGEMPYRDRWDFKTPGIFLLYALAFALFGQTMLAPRLLEVAGLVLMVFALRAVSAHFVASRRPGLLAGAAAALVQAQLEFWHTAQPETFAAQCILAALWVAVSDVPAARRWVVWLGVGALFGFVFLLKPPAAGGVLAVAVWLAHRRPARLPGLAARVVPIAVVAAGAAVPIALTLLWFVVRGGLAELIWTFRDFTPGYTSIGYGRLTAAEGFYYAAREAFFGYSAVLGLGVIAAVATPTIHEGEREGVLLALAIVAINCVGIAMQAKFFQYHYGATLPVIAFVAGVGLDKAWRRTRRHGLGGHVAFVASVALAVSMIRADRDLFPGFWERSVLRTNWLLGRAEFTSREILDERLYRVADYDLNEDRQVAAELRRLTPKDASVFVWGFEPAIYWLSGRAPASRFIYDVPQRAGWERERARADLMLDLQCNRPAAIVVQSGDVFAWVTGDYLDSAAALRPGPDGFAAFAALLAEYEYVGRTGDFDIYVDGGAAPGASDAAASPSPGLSDADVPPSPGASDKAAPSSSGASDTGASPGRGAPDPGEDAGGGR